MFNELKWPTSMWPCKPPLVGNHEHWNLQVVVKDRSGPPISPLHHAPSSHDKATSFTPSVLRESRKRKRRCSSPVSSSSSSRQSPGNEVPGRFTHRTSTAPDLSQHGGKVADERSRHGDSGLMSTVVITTIYEVLNQHPHFIASKIITTSIAPLASTPKPRKNVPATGPNTAVLGRNPNRDISTSKGASSRPNPLSQGSESPTASTGQDSELHIPSTSSSPYANLASSPSSSPAPSSSPPNLSPLPKNPQQRPPLSRLMHLTSLNPTDLPTLDKTVRQAKIDNETIHWNCQDYVMEILQALENECVIDPESGSSCSDLDFNISSDKDDPATPPFNGIENKRHGPGAGDGDGNNEHAATQSLCTPDPDQRHDKDTRDSSIDSGSDSHHHQRRASGHFDEQEQEHAQIQGEGRHYYTAQKRRVMRHFGPII